MNMRKIFLAAFISSLAAAACFLAYSFIFKHVDEKDPVSREG
jgi:uncharacterized protein with PQ loop repeat